MARAKYPIYPSFLVRIKLPTAEFTARAKCPVLVFHSPEDEIIPFPLGKKIFQAAPEPKAFCELCGDHNGCYFISEQLYTGKLKDWLDGILK